VATHRTLPGFHAPAVGFEQPFEMLEACHERVQRTLDLLARLISHIEQQGHDASSRSAATDVLRYFDLAAPLHHADEEAHVFPRLLAQDDPAQCQAVHRLLQEHREMETTWAALRPWLVQVAAVPTVSQALAPVSAEVRETAKHFAELYAGHLICEERWAFKQAREGLSEDALAQMGHSMQARRSPGA